MLKGCMRKYIDLELDLILRCEPYGKKIRIGFWRREGGGSEPEVLLSAAFTGLCNW